MGQFALTTLVNHQKRRPQTEEAAGRIQGILGTGTGQGQQANRAMQSDAHGPGIAEAQPLLANHGHPPLGHGLGQGHGYPPVRGQ